jgi:phytoene dehydrogenase-like protein
MTTSTQGNTTRYDVAIVGGGHNGLSAACYLALEGKKVLVIEALDKVGGMCSSGYVIPQAPQHLVHTCALDMMSLRVHPMMPLELGLAKHGFRHVEMTPAYVYLHPDGHSLVFWRDPQKTAAEIRRFSAKDADAFLAFMKVLDAFMDMAVPMMRVDPTRFNFGAKFEALRAVLRNKKLKPEILALATGSAYQATSASSTR